MHCKKNKKTGNLYFDNLCIFWCLTLHTGCTLQNLESKTKELFLCYCKFTLADRNNFQAVALHDLVQIENCFSLNVTVYALEWKEQAVAKILQRSRHLFSCSINLNFNENRFSYIKSMQMYTGRYVIQIFIVENISVLALAPLHLGQVRSCQQLFFTARFRHGAENSAKARSRQETFQVTQNFIFPNVQKRLIKYSKA